ncbi:hypothetical protein [Pararhizobium sp. DWP1-1-3]|uniref:hypothetical protein n=1 Tax=Pararhizobium sp. DWP1-1-3 TaxID=2804652 RepID=UPI003CF44E67
MDNIKARPADIKKVGDLEELRDYLRVLDLPGAAPPELVTTDAKVSDHETYTHNEGSMDEWSLTWTKIDGETELID